MKQKQTKEVKFTPLQEKFLSKANVAMASNCWITMNGKETDSYKKIAFNELDNVYNDDKHYFNFWVKLNDDTTEVEYQGVINYMKDLFYGSKYMIGLKFPYPSESGDALSFRIKKKDR